MNNNTMLNNVTVNNENNNNVEERKGDSAMMSVTDFEKKMAEIQAELLAKAFPKITTTTKQVTVKGVDKSFDAGRMESGNTVQRTDSWTPEQRDLFIHSILTGFPIPQIISIRSEMVGKNDKVFMVDDLIDGKQRTTTIRMFRKNKHRLGNIQPIVIDDTAYDISGMTYEELPESIRDEFDSRTLNFICIDGADDDTIAEIFKRLNNGTPLSAIEKTRVASKELKTIIEIGKHQFFHDVLTENALRKYTNEDIIIKTMMMLNVPKADICLDNKFVRPYYEAVRFEDENIEELNSIFDFGLRVTKYLSTVTGENAKKCKRIAKKVTVRTHFISLVPFMYDAVTNGYSAEDFADKFCVTFFESGSDDYDIYRANASSGSNHHAQVVKRWDVLEKVYNACKVNFRTQEEVDKLIAEKAEAEAKAKEEAEAKAKEEAEAKAKVKAEKEKAKAKAEKEKAKKKAEREAKKAEREAKKAEKAKAEAEKQAEARENKAENVKEDDEEIGFSEAEYAELENELAKEFGIA